jgi:hypothetical protein
MGYKNFFSISKINFYLRMMGLYKEAISKALKNNKLDIAKALAKKPDSEDLRKKMWLKVKNIIIFFL